LFKPFETTKAAQGMGIGAYLTRSYLEELGAILDVDSELGEGTVFTITFGARDETTAASPRSNTERTDSARSNADDE
jgi:signal transduction histidine kinase